MTSSEIIAKLIDELKILEYLNIEAQTFTIDDVCLNETVESSEMQRSTQESVIRVRVAYASIKIPEENAAKTDDATDLHQLQKGFILVTKKSIYSQEEEIMYQMPTLRVKEVSIEQE